MTKFTKEQQDILERAVSFLDDHTFDLETDGLRNIKGNVCGHIWGNVEGDVLGKVRGNVRGDVKGSVWGNVCGNVWGNVKGDVKGDVKGSVFGNVEGSVGGDVGVDVCGHVWGDVKDTVEGSVLGNVLGNVKGCVMGDVWGDVGGNVCGSVLGDVEGKLKSLPEENANENACNKSLVERLREYAQAAHMAASWGFAGEGFTMEKAADRIEELEREVGSLKKDLQESALDCLAADGQAADAYNSQVELDCERGSLVSRNECLKEQLNWWQNDSAAAWDMLEESWGEIEDLMKKLDRIKEALSEAIYMLDPDEEDIAKGAGRIYRIVTTYRDLYES